MHACRRRRDTLPLPSAGAAGSQLTIAQSWRPWHISRSPHLGMLQPTSRRARLWYLMAHRRDGSTPRRGAGGATGSDALLGAGVDDPLHNIAPCMLFLLCVLMLAHALSRRPDNWPAWGHACRETGPQRPVSSDLQAFDHLQATFTASENRRRGLLLRPPSMAIGPLGGRPAGRICALVLCPVNRGMHPCIPGALFVVSVYVTATARSCIMHTHSQARSAFALLAATTSTPAGG